MAFEKWGYTWEGAFTDPNKLEDRSGVYVIWCKTLEVWKVLDVGESATVKSRVLEHDRADCWAKNCRGTIHYAAHYTPGLQQSGRVEIEQRIRSITKPPCGER